MPRGEEPHNEWRHLTDEALVRLALVRREAFAELYRRYAGRVEAFVVRLARDREFARDITQETFLRAYRALPRFRPKAPFLFWLLAIARNLIVSRARKERRVVPLAEAHYFAHPASVIEEVDRAWMLERLAAAFRALRPRERAVLRAIYVEGKQLKDIARAWGVSENAVKLLVSRTRRKLRELLRAP